MAKHLGQISAMPQLKAVFTGWPVPITLQRITQTIVNGLRSQSKETISFKGVIQPLSKEELDLKPEGQRSWEWLQIHATAGETNLKTNDIIEYVGDDYKIMAKKDYTLNGYIEYHMVRDYE